jgi:hypothetical protein
MSDLDAFLRPTNAPITNVRQTIGFQFETSNEVQAKKIKLSNANVENFIGFVPGTVTSGTFGSAATVTYTTTAGFNSPYTYKMLIGIPAIAIYQGSSPIGSMQIYPDLGNGITGSQWNIVSGFNADTYRDYDGYNWQYLVRATYTGSGTVNITAVSNWKYLNTNSSGIST